MNIGDRIKQLRIEKNLTQPQLAEAIGIEQSYLSKLENDKSIPSAEIFQAILRALVVDVSKFLEGIDEKIIHSQLKQIPEVANYLNASIAYRIHNIKRWLYASAVACVLGLTMAFSGYQSLFFGKVLYEYESKIFLSQGETEDTVLHWQDYSAKTPCDYTVSVECVDEQKARKEKSKRVQALVKKETLLVPNYQGDIIYQNLKDGLREYHYRGERAFDPSANRYLMLAGVFLFIGGIFGFIVEARMRKL